MTPTNETITQPELTLIQVRESIRTCLTQGHVGHYTIGRLYNYTVASRLAQKHGYESAQRFFSQHFKELAQATLSRYGAVARQYTEEACTCHGVAKLAALSSYAKVAALTLMSADPGGLSIDVPQEGGAVTPTPFAECSLEALLRAVKHKRKMLKPSLSSQDVARVEFMRASFSRHFARGARVQLKTNLQGGRTLLTIQGVPLDDVERLAEALLDGLQPQLVRPTG